MQTLRVKSLKKISAIVAAAISIATYQPAQATALSASGRLNNVYVSDSTVGTNNLTLVGVSSLGGCATFFGLVIFRMKDDSRGQQMLALALAAASSGSTVFVNVDDTNRDSNGFCFVTGISFVGN